MLKPSEYFNYWGPFSFDPTMSGSGTILPALNEYPENQDSSGRMSLFRSNGLRPYDFNKIRSNIGNVQDKINRLVNSSFRDYSEINPARFKGKINNTGIVTQDEITNQPVADMTNVVRNRIPRNDNGGFFPMPNASTAQSGNGRVINPAGTEFFSTQRDKGLFVFAVSGVIRVWVSSAGWLIADPGTTVPPLLGFALDFNPNKSIWVVFKDNQPVAYVDGNVVTNNFVNSEPGDSTSFKTVKAYVDLDSINNIIQFSCQTANDTAIKGVGFIDVSGTNDGTGP